MKVSPYILFILIIYLFTITQSTETVSFTSPTTNEGYTISDNVVTISGAGPFEFTGEQEDKKIIIASSCTINFKDFILMNDEELTPLIINENIVVELVLEGEPTLEDSQNNENDGTIYLKSGASLIISGDGILNINPNKYMAINGTDDTSLTVNGGDIMISSESNTVGGIYLKKEINFNNANFYYNCENGIHHAIDSEGNIKLLKGEYSIDSGRGKGIHSEKYIQIGIENGETSDIYLKISTSDEGIEAMGITIFSGETIINSHEDGINADSSGNECDEECNGNCACFININDGLLNIISEEDGLDSNGDITISGGHTIIFAASQGEGRPIDQEGLFSVNGGSIIAAGSNSMSGLKAETTQVEKIYRGTINEEDYVAISENDVEIYNFKAPKKANYIYFNFESSFTVEVNNAQIKLLNPNEVSSDFGSYLFVSYLMVLFGIILL